jgi:hypothetical protein
MYSLFGAVLPGIFIWNWGKAGKRPTTAAASPLAPKAPIDRAAEMGHVITVDPPA